MGRSDAVLNPGGVRIGTTEIYQQVEQLDAVLEAVAVGQEWDGDVRVVLFVVLREGLALTDALTHEIKTRIRTGATPATCLRSCWLWRIFPAPAPARSPNSPSATSSMGVT